MDIQFYGGNCLVLTSKQTRVVVDDNLADLSGKSITKEGDVVLFTAAHGEPSAKPKIIIDQPGEYEVQGISIYGIPARGHMDEEAARTATIYKLIDDTSSILITGHVYPGLSDEQLEAIGSVDVMIVPVGGMGYTLDATGALTLIKEIEPRLIIPTHYGDKSLKFPVPQTELEEALKGLGMEPKERLSKLRLKPADFTDIAQLVILEKS
jgi:L-ascorbate metabolism protein UlaG (beta-lactamase superfamily)